MANTFSMLCYLHSFHLTPSIAVNASISYTVHAAECIRYMTRYVTVVYSPVSEAIQQNAVCHYLL